MHARTQIRNDIVGCLSTSLPEGVGVIASRRLPLTPQDLPRVLVYTDHEQSEIYNESPRVTKNTLDLTIEILVSDSEATERKLDDLCFATESALSAMILENTCISKIVLKSTTIDSSTQTENLLGIAKMVFEVIYLTEYSNDYLHLVDFESPQMEIH